MGTRVWCRFGCPMAALLGLIQKFGRFRITVKKDMCIACGNCSTYCEMGIDVRAYAQANQDVKRAACVGCGMCAHVCPRGCSDSRTGPCPGRRDSRSGSIPETCRADSTRDELARRALPRAPMTVGQGLSLDPAIAAEKLSRPGS